MTGIDRKSFLLRIDPVVWAELEQLARADLRSVNAEVEFLLRDALARRGRNLKSRRKSRRSGATHSQP